MKKLNMSQTNLKQPSTNDGPALRSIKAKADYNRSLSERIADRLTLSFGNMIFFILNLVWFIAWIVINIGLIPGIEPFDPFPFGFLTMVVSLEAIALAIIVLMSQNRAAKIADLREEVDLQVNKITEKELTKLLEIAAMLAEKEGIDLSQDEVLQKMLKRTDTKKLEAALEKEIQG
jgi:uncharacterized membrane protein